VKLTKLTMMQHLPKLVDVLLNKAQPATHPDADQLTAFAEHALTGNERGQVLEHLALCAECREVLSIAQVQLPDALPIATAAKHTWFRMPKLRWVTAAALVVIAGSTAIVTMHRKSGTTPARAAKLEVNSAFSREDKLGLAVPAPEKQFDQLTKAQSETVTLSQSPRRTQPRQDHKIYALKAKPPLPPTERTEEAESESSLGLVARTRDTLVPPSSPSPKNRQEGLAPGSEALETRSENVEVAAAAPAATAEVSKAKKPVSNTMAQADSAIAGDTGERNFISSLQKTPTSHAIFRLTKTSPRWTISADGALERSFDSGKTWEKVIVAGSTNFRAVSAVGPDVWAGGSTGMLYHSPDAGQQWIRVQPTGAGAALKGDVTSVEFTDARHGKLTTADGEIWKTSDAGQSWQVLRP
jgi:Photosynthesis system II assembly factor YCF48/Putative zinc-finger